MSEDKDKDRRDVLRVINAQIVASHQLNADPSNFVINQNSLADALTDYVATVRREAREEAFKDGVKIIEALVCPSQFDGNWRNGYSHAQNDAFRALERAADSREGENDG